MCALTWALYGSTLAAEMLLRYNGRIPRPTRTVEVVFGWISAFFGIVGGGSLLFLS